MSGKLVGVGNTTSEGRPILPLPWPRKTNRLFWLGVYCWSGCATTSSHPSLLKSATARWKVRKFKPIVCVRLNAPVALPSSILIEPLGKFVPDAVGVTATTRSG